MTRPRNTSKVVHHYARDVVAGDIVAGPHVRAACQRHLDDLENGAARGLHFDVAAADRAIEFFPDVLRLNGGDFDGIPFHLHPAQAFIVGSIFGWKKADGTRRFQDAYVEQGKGNGKSPLAGGIGLYLMVADGEPAAEIYAAAAKLDQAQILFRDAVSMVRQSPALTEHLDLSGANPVHTISLLKNSSFFKPLGRDTGKTGSGLRPHGILVDELHEHPNRDTVETLKRGFKGRRQPLLFLITNSGSDRGSYCYEWHEHAKRAAHREYEKSEERIMDRTFSYICAMDEEDDPLDMEYDDDGNIVAYPECWVKANPLLGTILTEEYLADCAAEALAVPGRANYIRRLHFCQWTESESSWISRDLWDAAEDPSFDIEDFDGAECWIGLDLGGTRDLTARVSVFLDGETDEGLPKFAMFAHAYTPADTLRDRAKKDKAFYVEWVEGGYVTATPGKVTRYEFVAQDIVDFGSRHDIQCLAYDKWMFSKFEDCLDEHNVTLPLVQHPQGYQKSKDTELWMPGSIEAMENLLLEGRLRIAVNPALRSAVSAATFTESPAGLRRLDKKKATSRIDLAVAACMAVGAAVEQAGEATSPRETYLDEMGLVVL